MRALLALIALAEIAHAEPVPLPNTKARLDVPASWTRLPAHPDLVAAYKSPAGHLLALTRAKVPNLAAWRKRSRDAYAREIEAGALAAMPGQTIVARKLSDVNGMPAFDLELRRTDGSLVMLRVLLFRSYALATAIAIPKTASKTSIDDARAILAGFAIPKPAPRT